ncbi:MAG: hypothetical protein ACPG4T_13590 [Nannocystaceae bacterium]
MPEGALRRALASVPRSSCRQQVEQEVKQGRRLSTGCTQAREQLTRALIRTSKPSPVFGVVEQRRADVDGVMLTLSVARNCHQWLLRSPDSDVLRPADLANARCRQSRYTGPLPLAGILANGTRVEAVHTLQIPETGRFSLTYATLEQSLVRQGQPGIDGFVRFELGHGGWAGTIDAEALRRGLREAHLRWVLAGRGVPALFAVRHPDHKRASTVRALANTSTLIREERDYHAVLAGEMPPERFLERYLASRFRREIEGRLTPNSNDVAGSQ